MMFAFLKLQYDMGRINAEQLKKYKPRWITEEEYDLIVGGGE